MERPFSMARLRPMVTVLSLTCAALLALPAGAAELRVVDGSVLLTLDEAIEIAIEQNLSIQIERYNREQFALGIDEAMGIYDLNTEGFVQINENTTPTIDPFISGADILTRETQILNLGLSQLTPIGGVVSVDYNNSRSESNSARAITNPAFDVDFQVGYNLPLLQGFGRLATERGVMVARIQEESNREFFEEQVLGVVQQIQDAYWDLVNARKQLEVAEESLELAEELHRRNRIQVEVGTRPPLDLVQSEATVATRREEIIRARTTVGNAQDRLLLLLSLDAGPAWDTELVPETAAETEPLPIDLEGALQTALGNRREIRRQKLEIDRLDIENRFAQNQVRPRLDLNVSYGLSGIGGDTLVTDERGNPIPNPQTGEPVVLPGGYSDALGQVTDLDFDNWAVALTFGYPLQNRAAKAASARAGLELEKGNTSLKQIEQQIINEVRTASRELEAAAQQIESAGVSRRLQERNLDAEQRRYENGMSTSFQITEIQEDLAQAQSREVTAITSYRKALTEYYRALGSLLQESGISLE